MMPRTHEGGAEGLHDTQYHIQTSHLSRMAEFDVQHPCLTLPPARRVPWSIVLHDSLCGPRSSTTCRARRGHITLRLPQCLFHFLLYLLAISQTSHRFRSLFVFRFKSARHGLDTRSFPMAIAPSPVIRAANPSSRIFISTANLI